MRNRAKCRVCSDIIESVDETVISCECGEISVFGADKLGVGARDFKNFLRLDDGDNEIEVHYQDRDDKKPEENKTKLTRNQLLDMLDAMAKNIEELPPHAMQLPISHYDHYSLMLVLSSIFRSA